MSKELNGVTIVSGDLHIGVIKSIKISRSNVMRKVFEINYYPGMQFVGGRSRGTLEKYGVKTDPKKVADAKKGKGEKTASVDDPNTNVPLDPDKGTEPFETEPKDG